MNIITGYTGKKHVTAGNDGCLNMGFAGTDDYVLNVGKKLEAQIVSNNQVRIFDGEILMQGRQASIDAGTYEDVNIENGEQLLGRNDLIVARYTLDSETAVEKIELAVVKGTAAETAEDPEITEGDIRNEASLHEMPLYRVKLEGLTLTAVEPLFQVLPSLTDIQGALGVEKIVAVSELPSSPADNTLYLIQEV